jgi:aspartyl-tRNA(Asn)/glutamyl-tRNA(Gln) amidotransferase subunit A
VEDAAILLGVIAGFDPRDPTTVDVPVPDYTRALKTRVSRLRIGIPRAPFFNNLDPEVAKATEVALDLLTKLTAGLRDVQLPPSGNGAAVFGPEAYAYHAQWITKTPEKYQPATRRVILGAAENKADAYASALRQLSLVRREIRKTFDEVDVLVTPTMGAPPGLIQDPNAPPAPTSGAPRGGNNAQAFDAYGLPAISLPCGFTNSGLPIGLQIVGAPFAEATVFALAHAYEQATEWHNRRPNI